MNLKKLSALLIAVICSFSVLSGCSSSSSESSSASSSSAGSSQKGARATVESVTVVDSSEDDDEEDFSGPMRIAFLKGPTGLGAAGLMNEKDHGKVWGKYDFQIYTTPDEITSKLINGELDVAAVPTNVASVLYNKTGGEILIGAINTLGTLYIVENGNTINSVRDLNGKTIVSAGQGAVPEYVLQYILGKNGISANINFVSSHAEAASAIASGKADIALLPEPFVSVATSKNSSLRIALDVAQEWDKYSYEEEKVANTLPMGCIVVRKAYLEQRESRFKKFLDEYEFFVEEAVEDPATAAQYSVDYGIMDDAAIAEKAIPNCNLCFIDGRKMMRLMKNFIEIMNEANPKSIGGSIPDDNFYYIR